MTSTTARQAHLVCLADVEPATIPTPPPGTPRLSFAELAELLTRFELARPGTLTKAERARRALAAKDLRSYAQQRVDAVDGTTEGLMQRLKATGRY